MNDLYQDLIHVFSQIGHMVVTNPIAGLVYLVIILLAWRITYRSSRSRR
jgi:hypothetical protein